MKTSCFDEIHRRILSEEMRLLTDVFSWAHAKLRSGQASLASHLTPAHLAASDLRLPHYPRSPAPPSLASVVDLNR